MNARSVVSLFTVFSLFVSCGVGQLAGEIGGDSADSSSALSAPSSLTGKAYGTPRVDLEWSAVAGAASFRVWRGDANWSHWVMVGEVAGNVTRFSDTSVAGSTTYTYGLRAIDPAGGISGPSPVLRIAVPAATGVPAPVPDAGAVLIPPAVVDAGTPRPVDAGTAVADAGAPKDAGTPVVDAGTITPPPPPPPPTGTPTNGLFVSPAGNDSNAGTAAAPFRTLSRAASAVRAGQTVYLRAGVYPTANVNLGASGTSSARVTYASYPGEVAILDGSGAALGSSGSMVSITGSYVDFRDLELRNSSGRGITITGNKSAVLNCKMHDMQYNGLIAGGVDQLIEGNEVWNTTLSNLNGAKGSSGWAEAMNTWQSTNTVFRNNYIHDNWGEGIDFIASSGGLAEGNRVIDNYSVEIYIDGTSGVTISNNEIASTKSTYNRGSSPPIGVMMADESGSRGVSNITITNNVLRKTGGIRTWNVTVTNLVQSGNVIQ